MNMTFFDILKLPKNFFLRDTSAVFMLLSIIIASTVYPSDMKNDYPIKHDGPTPKIVVFTEKYGRHINTILPFATIVVLRDWTGLRQIGVVTIAGILASHGPKRLLNDVTVMGTRLGQRPNSPHSRHNMPSGHSTLASAGAYFMMRRYSLLFGLIVIPIMLLTLYARVMLDAHTISATIAGAFTGILVTALFSTKWRKHTISKF
jgi:lipid A 1-phosphatase